MAAAPLPLVGLAGIAGVHAGAGGQAGSFGLGAARPGGMTGMGIGMATYGMGGFAMPGGTGGMNIMSGFGGTGMQQAPSQGPRRFGVRPVSRLMQPKSIGNKITAWNQVDQNDMWHWLAMTAPSLWHAMNIPGSEQDRWAHAAVAWDVYADTAFGFRGLADQFGVQLAQYHVQRGQPLLHKTISEITQLGMQLIHARAQQVQDMLNDQARTLGYAVGPDAEQGGLHQQPASQFSPAAPSALQLARERAAQLAAQQAAQQVAGSPHHPLTLVATPTHQSRPTLVGTPSPLTVAKAKAAARHAADQGHAAPEVIRKRLFSEMTSPPPRTA